MKTCTFKVVRRILLFLLLGAILNVGVAWTAMLSQASIRQVKAAETDAFRLDARTLDANEMAWYTDNEEVLSADLWAMNRYDELVRREPTMIDCTTGFGLKQHVLVETWKRPDAERIEFRAAKGLTSIDGVTQVKVHTASRVTAGWPFSILRISFWSPYSIVWSDGRTERRKEHSGWDVPECLGLFPDREGFVVPTEPIWANLAIGTVFYAIVLWLVFAVPLALRRRRRIKRGLCSKCAYDLRGRADSQTCPECGRAVKT